MRRAAELERTDNGRFAAGNSLTLLPHSPQAGECVALPRSCFGLVSASATWNVTIESRIVRRATGARSIVQRFPDNASS